MALFEDVCTVQKAIENLRFGRRSHPGILERKKKFEKNRLLVNKNVEMKEKHLSQTDEYLLLKSVIESMQMIEQVGNFTLLNSLKEILEKNLNIINHKITLQSREAMFTKSSESSFITKTNLFSNTPISHVDDTKDQANLIDHNYSG